MSKNKKPHPLFGDCYESSFNACKELNQIKQLVEGLNLTDFPEKQRTEIEDIYQKFALNNEIKIIHGWVKPPKGPVKNKEIHHSWIQIDQIVIETSLGQQKPYTKEVYYKLYQVKIDREYSLDDAIILTKRTGFIGNWTSRPYQGGQNS